jgi:hypothetical protein
LIENNCPPNNWKWVYSRQEEFHKRQRKNNDVEKQRVVTPHKSMDGRGRLQHRPTVDYKNVVASRTGMKSIV